MLNETLSDFIIGTSTNENALANDTLEQQTNGQHNNSEKLVDCASQNQIMEITIGDNFLRHWKTTRRFLINC